MKSIVETRFPKSKIFLEEFVKGKDGKMRYLKKTRQLLYNTVQKKISRLAPQIPTYLCMEKKSVWENSMMSYNPKTSHDVENHITSKLKKQIPI